MRKVEIKKTIYFPKIDTELKLWKIKDDSLIEQNYISIKRKDKIKTEFMGNLIKASIRYAKMKIILQKIEDTLLEE